MNIYRLTNVVNAIHHLCSEEAVWSEPLVTPILRHLLDVQVLGRSIGDYKPELVSTLRYTLQHSGLDIHTTIEDLNLAMLVDLNGGIDPSEPHSYRIHTTHTRDETLYSVIVEPSGNIDAESLRRTYAAEAKLAMSAYMDYALLEDPVDAFRELYPDLRIRT